MLAYAIRRLLLLIPTLLLITMAVFGLLMLIPGDPVMAILQEAYTPEIYEAVKHDLGFDRPLYIQYFDWLWRTLHGDLGRSIHSHIPITTLIAQHLPRTFYLALGALLVSLMVALPAGIISAVRRNSIFDIGATVGAMAGVAIPNFWLGVMFILVFGVTLRWLPVAGWIEPLKDPVDFLRHMIMPCVALGAALAAEVARMTRSSVVEVMEQEYIVTARSKGLREAMVVRAHALKNALIPVVTIVGLQVGRLFGGTMVIEIVFAVPGVGTLIVNAVYVRDFPVVQGGLLVMAMVVLLSNLIVDLLYGYLDPRIKYG